jgi:two-component system NtrC family sensor kinase
MYAAPIPENDTVRLETLYKYAILDSQPEQGYDDVTELASYLCGTPFATITLVDKERQWFKSELGFGTNETGRADGFCACALLQPETLIVEDTLKDPRFCQNPFVLGGPKIRFYAGAPLIAPNGHILGTVCVFDTKPRELSAGQIKALQSLARQVMALLEARLQLIENGRAAAALMQTEKLAAVGRVASSMAHGINNPLEAVTNLLYLSRLETEPGRVRDWLDQADQELRRVAVIANQTLRFHKQASKPRAITCGDLFSTTLLVFEARLRNSGIAVEKRKRANEPVECFEGDVRQVLGNIVANSIDAMPIGGRLLVRSREGTDWKTGRKGLVLTIADSGLGMDPEAQRRKFEAFYSTKGIGGTGLGLWMSAEIMHRHEGTIRIRSSQSSFAHGTVATLFLPFNTRDSKPIDSNTKMPDR